MNKIEKTTIRIVHWEWRHNGLYDLLIDIVFNPGKDEHGVICHDDEIIYHNDKQELKIKDNYLENRLTSFEHIRKNDCQEHTQCISTQRDLEDMENELIEEEVSEEEFLNLNKAYQSHSAKSSNDASSNTNSDDSDVSSDNASDISE